MKLTFTMSPNGQIVMLGAIQVGLVIMQGTLEKRTAAWISFLPLRSYGIRMGTPLRVGSMMEARAAIRADVREWLKLAGLKQVGS